MNDNYTTNLSAAQALDHLRIEIAFCLDASLEIEGLKKANFQIPNARMVPILRRWTKLANCAATLPVNGRSEQ